MKNIKKEGFWKSIYDEELPAPVSRVRPMEDKAAFLTALDAVQDKATRTSYRGLSYCRICEMQNGNGTYEYEGWMWPTGYRHYIEVHNVKPSSAFKEFIMSQVKVQTPKTVEPTVSRYELRTLMGVVMEYTGSERVRLYSILTVKKLQRQLDGHKIPAAVAKLTETATEDELNKAIKRLGD